MRQKDKLFFGLAFVVVGELSLTIVPIIFEKYR